MLLQAQNLLVQVLQSGNVDTGHGLDHALAVLNHANNALQYEDLPDDTKQAIQLAALLHDADDSKFFPDNNDNQNARYILREIGAENELAELVIKMIELVSCSKNGNTVVKPEWLLLPRFADRLESMGCIGIVRSYQYTTFKKRPLFLDSTPRVKDTTELAAVATPERFSKYSGKSESMIDHFYDKVLHLKNMETDNEYIRREADARHQVLVDFCIQFGYTGQINEEEIHRWEQEL